MIIKDIKDIHTNETRTDDKYPDRIGSKVHFVYLPVVGSVMILGYDKDNMGNEKTGYLKTSAVSEIVEDENNVIIYTRNSIYHLEKEHLPS